MPVINPQLPLSISPGIGKRFGSFFVGENRLLIDLARDTAERGGEPQLGIWGGSGVGKSHVLNAVCHAASDCARTAAYLPLVDLIGQSPKLLQGLETVDVIAIDDLDILHGYHLWQYELFNLINRAYQRRTCLVTASQNPPSSLELLPDLVSRLVWGPVLHLQTPNDDALAEALLARATSLGLNMPVEVVNYLLSHHTRDIGRLFGIVAELDRASLIEQRKLTVPFVRSVLINTKK